MMRALLLVVVVACAPSERPAPPVSPIHAVAPPDVAPPVAVPPVWDRGTLVAGHQMCALVAGGQVMCWGENFLGEVGDAPRYAHKVPMLVPGVTHAVRLGASQGGACAVLDDGHVQCWGSYEPKLAAVHTIPELDNVIEIAVMAEQRCAQRRDASVWCWSSRDPAVKPEPIDVLGPARQLASGYQFACTIGVDTKVRCMSWWTGANQQPTFSELEIPEAAGAITIAAFYENACAVLRDRSVTCWSLKREDHGGPALSIAKVPGLTDVVDLNVGVSKICAARRDATIACWGTGTHDPARPEAALRGFKALASAIGGSQCGMRSDRSIACWGDQYGLLGRYTSWGAQPTPVEIPNLGDAAELALELEKSCARTTQGGVSCWTGKTKPVEDLHLQHATRLFAGRFNTCAMVGGKPSCWGLITWTECRWLSPDNCQHDRLATPKQVPGLLGIPSAVTIAEPCAIDGRGHVLCRITTMSTSKTVEVPGLANVTAVSGHCAVVGGRVSCWTRDADPPASAAVSGLESVTQVVSGYEHDCALARSGQVSCWGSNHAGELGDGTHVSRTEPKPIASLTDAVELAAGDRFTCARTKRRGIFCWGANEWGALGDGSGRDQITPVHVAGLDDAVELRANGMHACVRRANHHVACWGHWAEGAAGNVTIADALPVLAPDSLEP